MVKWLLTSSHTAADEDTSITVIQVAASRDAYSDSDSEHVAATNTSQSTVVASAILATLPVKAYYLNVHTIDKGHLLSF